MSSNRRGVLVVNGFGLGSLIVAETCMLYKACYPVLSDMRLARNGGLKMAINGIGILPAATPGMDR
jgi:hypothetical protein